MVVGLISLIALGAVGVGVAFATTRSDPPLDPGTARLVPGGAAVTVHRGSFTAAADAPLRSGDSLTVTRGIAILQTSAGRLLAREGATIAFDDASARLVRGDVLVDAVKFSLATQVANVVVDGVARVRQALSLEVGVYKGAATVSTAIDSLRVPALRRVGVAGALGVATAHTMPLVLDPNDSWDRRLMGTALELDSVLSSRSRGLTAQTAGASEKVRDQILSVASGWSDVSALSDQPVGEVVVAAELQKAARLSNFAMRSALALRAEGASWGLVAVSQGVKVLPAALPGIDEAAVPAVHAVSTLSDPVTTTFTPPAAGFGGSQEPVDQVPVAGRITVAPAAEPGEQPALVVSDPLGPLVSTVGSILSGLLGS